MPPYASFLERSWGRGAVCTSVTWLLSEPQPSWAQEAAPEPPTVSLGSLRFPTEHVSMNECRVTKVPQPAPCFPEDRNSPLHPLTGSVVLPEAAQC